MEVVTREAKKKGYAPDFLATADDTNQFGRPYPYMLFRNIEALQIQSTKSVVKVGDTTSDMQEAKNAGVLAIGANYTIETMPDLLPLLEQIAKPVMM